MSLFELPASRFNLGRIVGGHAFQHEVDAIRPVQTDLGHKFMQELKAGLSEILAQLGIGDKGASFAAALKAKKFF